MAFPIGVSVSRRVCRLALLEPCARPGVVAPRRGGDRRVTGDSGRLSTRKWEPLAIGCTCDPPDTRRIQCIPATYGH